MRSIKWLAYSLVLCSIALSTAGDAGAAVSGPKTGVVCLDNTDLAASDLLAAKQAAHLLALPVPRSRTKPDLAGCLTKASQIFPRRGAQYLVLVSSLRASPDSVGALRLPGVDVDVLFICQSDTATCVRRREGWIRAFQRMGTIDGVFWDVSQRPTLFAGS